MDLQTFFQSKQFKWIVGGLGTLIVLLVVFQLGLFVGFHKARFSYRWADNYHREFGGPQGGWLRDFEGRDFVNGNGTTGTIAKLDTNTLVIKDSAGVEKVVNVTSTTSIREGRAVVQLSQLKVNDTVVVIGSSNSDGSIAASVIRVFDPLTAPVAPPFPVPGERRY